MQGDTSHQPPGSEVREIRRAVERYYAGKFSEHGETPRGVDWSSDEHQTARFEALLRLLDGETTAGRKILDYGCGYGALFLFLRERHPGLSYTGFDLCSEMLSTAARFQPARWLSKLNEGESFDYVVASGIFNV